jgi:CRP-like cAMP-binding protein
MSRSDVERLVVEQPRVALRMMEVLAQRLALAEARLEEMAYRGVAARIAAVLLRLERERSGTTVAITHQELGDMIGALRETVTKTLDEFQDHGLVELGRGKITLRDPTALRALLEQ